MKHQLSIHELTLNVQSLSSILRRELAGLVCILFTLTLSAQNAEPDRAAGTPARNAAQVGPGQAGTGRRGGDRGGGFGFGRPAVVSPEVLADRRVTFRLAAPNAQQVNVTGMPGGNLAMEKNEQGIWTATTAAPLAPDLYQYSFSVDGPAGGNRGGGTGNVGMTGAGPLFEARLPLLLPNLTAQSNDQIKLLKIDVGTSDGLLGVNRQLKVYLDSKRIRNTYTEYPNYGHEWPLWQRNFAEFAQLVFK